MGPFPGLPATWPGGRVFCCRPFPQMTRATVQCQPAQPALARRGSCSTEAQSRQKMPSRGPGGHSVKPAGDARWWMVRPEAPFFGPERPGSVRAMRRLLPGPLEEVDPRSAYALGRPRPGDRPWLLVNMVTSLDGAVAIDGRSGALGGPGDHLVFHALRSLADVILVGAATVRAERYGPVRLPPEVQE